MLRLGSKGEEAAAWQTFLRDQGFDPGSVDGVFGSATDAATRHWQASRRLDGDGVVGPMSYAAALANGFRLTTGEYRWIPARWFTPASGRAITLLVVHTTEGPEAERRSEATAAWFADERSKSSAHYIVDPAQTVQCVRDEDIAWHSGHKATNARSLGVEHCGRAAQTAAEWDDENSRAELGRSVVLVAGLCEQYGIPARWLTAAELKAGEPGICGHDTVTAAFLGGKGHSDPGRFYPRDWYVGQLATALAASDR